MKNSGFIFLFASAFCLARHSVSLSVIDSLQAPPVDSALVHAALYSPLLYSSDQRLDKAEHYTAKWGFVASLIPSPSYSFSELDRGWRLSFSVGSLVTAWKSFAKSRLVIDNSKSALAYRRETLVYTLVKTYSDFEMSLIELNQSRASLASETSKTEIVRAKHLAGKASDIERITAENSLTQAANSAALSLCNAKASCLNIYRIAGYRLKQPFLDP